MGSATIYGNAYCILMLSCFGEKVHIPNLPNTCETFRAPSNGIGPDDIFSIVSTGPSPVGCSPNQGQLNTLVLKNASFTDPFYAESEAIFPVQSLVFDPLQLSENNPGWASIFNIFDRSTLKYLIFFHTDFTLFSSTPSDMFATFSLSDYTAIEVIQIEFCTLPVLDGHFLDIPYGQLQSLVVISSKLQYILPKMFTDKNALERIILVDNQLMNLNWLTETDTRLKSLIHLDLSRNLLHFLPDNLLAHIPNIRVLHLGMNQFKFFTQTMLAPFYHLEEFNLGPLTFPETSSVLWTQNFLYTSEFKEAVDNLKQVTGNLPAYFLDLFAYNMSILCKNGQRFDYFNELNQANCPPFEKVPRPLENNNGQFYQFQTEQFKIGQSQIPSVYFLHGFNFKVEIPDPTSYRQTKYETRENFRKLFISQLTQIKPQYPTTTIRVNIGKLFINIFNNLIDSLEVNTIIHFTIDLLDEALRQNKFVMLVFWKNEGFREGTFTDPKMANDLMANTEQLFIPLFTRLSNHPALLGIELVENYLSECSGSPTGYFGEPCPGEKSQTFSQAILPKLRFFSDIAKLVKPYGIPIGVSLLSSCIRCFPIAFNRQYHPAGFTPFNFVLFKSRIEPSSKKEVIQEPYGYLALPEYRKSWFSSDIAVFYLFTGYEGDTVFSKDNMKLLGDAVDAMNDFAAGYFINFHFDSIHHLHLIN